MHHVEWWLEDHLVFAFVAAWLVVFVTVFFSLRAVRRAVKGRRWGRVALTAVWAAGSLYLLAGLGKGTLKLWPEVRRHAQVVGERMPALSYTTIADGTVGDVAALHGKVVVINKWGTYCQPCREEQPLLDKLQRTYEKQGLIVLQISQESQAQIATFLARFPVQTLVARADAFPLPVPSLPATFVVDRDGVIRKVLRGSQRYDRLVAAVEDVL
jgi:cytochrome c biogenesis protein CcmG/thiol:disulfide interchange protein DsbE